MTDLLSKIRQRGFWQVIIRPSKFISNRVPDISALLPILSKCVVQIRGWDFPHINNQTPTQIDVDWVGQESDKDLHKGIWRLFQSGQFIYTLGMTVDWRDESTWWPADPNWQPMTLLGVGDTIFTFVEILEFASRLALTDVGDEQMHIDIKVGNTKGRNLYIDSSRFRWPFDYPHITQMNNYPYSVEKPRADLISNYKSIAIDASQQFFKRFGWEASKEIIEGWYEKRG